MYQSSYKIRRPSAFNGVMRRYLLPGIYFATVACALSDSLPLPALAPPSGEIPAPFWQQHEVAIIVGSLVLLLALLVGGVCLLRPKTPHPILPEVEARRALSSWTSRPEDGKLLSEVSRILRQYTAAAFALPGDEMTTAEFCIWLNASREMDKELAGSIGGFLRECDERKFAPATPSAALNAAARALDLIALAESKRAALRQTKTAS